MAIKALKGEQDARLQASFLKEIDILRRSRHPHIVQYLGAVAAGNHTLLVSCNAVLPSTISRTD